MWAGFGYNLPWYVRFFKKLKTMGGIFTLIGVTVVFTTIVGVAMYQRETKMAAIEEQFNCRYDYNDLCYTEAERPWLFRK